MHCAQTGVPRTRFHDVNLHQLNEDELRDLVIDFRKHYDKEFRRFDDSQRALTGDLIAAKMQAAQLDYDCNQLRLEKAKLQKNVALLKLRLLEDQRKLTKLEASLAKAAS